MPSSKTSRHRTGDVTPGDGARIVLTDAPLTTLPFRLPAVLLPDTIRGRDSERETVGEGFRGPASETCASFLAGDARGDASGASARLMPGGETDAERNWGGVSRWCEEASLSGVGEWSRAKGIGAGELRAKGESPGERSAASGEGEYAGADMG